MVTRVIWNTFDQYPLTLLHCHAWALGCAEICTGSVEQSMEGTVHFLFRNRKNIIELEHNSNIDIQGVRYSGLGMNNATSLYSS